MSGVTIATIPEVTITTLQHHQIVAVVHSNSDNKLLNTVVYFTLLLSIRVISPVWYSFPFLSLPEAGGVVVDQDSAGACMCLNGPFSIENILTTFWKCNSKNVVNCDKFNILFLRFRSVFVVSVTSNLEKRVSRPPKNLYTKKNIEIRRI